MNKNLGFCAKINNYDMRRYFKGNTPARNRRIAAIHKKFKRHQATWALKRFARHNHWWRNNFKHK